MYVLISCARYAGNRHSASHKVIIDNRVHVNKYNIVFARAIHDRGRERRNLLRVLIARVRVIYYRSKNVFHRRRENSVIPAKNEITYNILLCAIEERQ